MTLQIAPLAVADRLPWEALARGYKAFYETEVSPSQYETAWQRLLHHENTREDVFGLGAHLDGRLVGITHYLFHTSAWAPRVCYLQDLFTAPSERGRGVGRALITAVGAQARADGIRRLYWQTHESNRAGRTLYDKVAQHHGFIVYAQDLTG